MKQEHIGFAVLAVLLIGGLVLARAVGISGAPPHADGPAAITAGTLALSDGWVAAPIAGQDRTAAYFTLRNDSDGEERLTGVSAPAAASAEMHRSMIEDGVARMERLDAVILPARTDVAFAPGGFHVMLMGLTEDLPEGNRLALTLHFLEAGDVTVDLPVLSRAEMMEHAAP